MNKLKYNRPTILLLDDDMLTLTLTASMLKRVNIVKRSATLVKIFKNI